MAAEWDNLLTAAERNAAAALRAIADNTEPPEGGDPGGPAKPGNGESDEENEDDQGGEPGEPGESGDEDSDTPGKAGDSHQEDGTPSDGTDLRNELEKLYDEAVDSLHDAKVGDQGVDMSSMTPEEKAEAARIQEEADKSFNEAVKGSIPNIDKLSPEERRELEDTGAFRNHPGNRKNLSTWQEILATALKRALGRKTYNSPNMPNRRNPEVGYGEVTKRVVKNIVITCDKSGSMHVKNFAIVLEEINKILTSPELSQYVKNARFHIFYWGYGPSEFKLLQPVPFRGDVLGMLLSGEKGIPGSWSTDPAYMFAYLATHVKKPDVTIVLTDASFAPPQREYSGTAIKWTMAQGQAGRLIWVLTPVHDKHWAWYDPGADNPRNGIRVVVP